VKKITNLPNPFSDPNPNHNPEISSASFLRLRSCNQVDIHGECHRGECLGLVAGRRPGVDSDVIGQCLANIRDVITWSLSAE